MITATPEIAEEEKKWLIVFGSPELADFCDLLYLSILVKKLNATQTGSAQTLLY